MKGYKNIGISKQQSVNFKDKRCNRTWENRLKDKQVYTEQKKQMIEAIKQKKSKVN